MKDKRQECGCSEEVSAPREVVKACSLPIRDCRWPDCLTAEEAAELDREVMEMLLGDLP